MLTPRTNAEKVNCVSFCVSFLVGRAAVARVLKGLHAGRLPQLRSTQAGLTVLNPSPSKARKKGGCLAVTLTRPGGLGGNRTRTPASVVEPKGKKGQTNFQDL